MKHIKLYEEFVNEAIDTKYWSGYNTDTSGQGDKKFADKSKNFDDTFDYAVEAWNNEADGPENKIKGSAINKIQKLAKEFFKKEGWISVNVVQAMIMQESGVAESNEVNEGYSSSDIKKLKVFATQVSDEINDEYDVARFADEEEYSPEAMLDYIKGWGEDNKLSAKQVIDEFDWTTLIMELGLGESVVNEAQTDNDYTFDNLQDYRKAVAALYNAGFYRSGNGNPPTGDETGTYQEDEHWLNLRIIDGEKDAAKVLKKTKLKYNAKYQKPTGYTVFNHGGHLD